MPKVISGNSTRCRIFSVAGKDSSVSPAKNTTYAKAKILSEQKPATKNFRLPAMRSCEIQTSFGSLSPHELELDELVFSLTNAETA